jgi:hypothetical protein
MQMLRFERSRLLKPQSRVCFAKAPNSDHQPLAPENGEPSRVFGQPVWRSGSINTGFLDGLDSEARWVALQQRQKEIAASQQSLRALVEDEPGLKVRQVRRVAVAICLGQSDVLVDFICRPRSMEMQTPSSNLPRTTCKAFLGLPRTSARLSHGYSELQRKMSGVHTSFSASGEPQASPVRAICRWQSRFTKKDVILGTPSPCIK